MAIDKDAEIRKTYTPTDKEYRYLKHVYERKQQMADKRAEYEDDWEKWEKQWDSYRLPKDADDWRSNIFVPMTSSIIEAQLAEMVAQNLMPWAVERGSEDIPKAQVMNAIIQYTWERAKSNVALFEIIKDALICGTGIGMEYYWQQPRTIKTKEGKEKKVMEYDDCYLEPVRLWDFFIDERARGFSGPYSANDAIRRYIMDYDDFRNFFQGKVWDPQNNASKVKPGGDTNYYEFYKPPERMQHDKEVEVLWYWNKPEDLLAIVANDVMVKMDPLPYKHKQLPFVRAIDIKKTHQFYGKGEAELLESLQDEINTLRRMIIDRNHLDIDKPFLVSDTLTIEDEDAITRPHGIIPVGDTNSVKPLEYSDIPKSVFLSLEMLNDDKIRVTGMDERQQSVSKAGTATEAAILKEATLKRLALKIWQLKNDTIVDIGRLRVANIMQYYSQPKLQKIVGDDMVAKAKAEGILIKDEENDENYIETYRNIRLEDMAFDVNPKTGQPQISPAKGNTFFEAKPEFFMPSYGGYDIRFKTTSSLPISKPLEMQKADEMYDRLAGNPTVDPWKLAEFLIKSRDKDPDDFKMKKEGTQDKTGMRLKQMVDLAGLENERMVKGEEIGPTPYASPAHTDIHIRFMQSNRFKEDVPPNSNTLEIFSKHVMGEVIAQQTRGATGQGLPQGGGGVPGMGGRVPGAKSMGGTNLDMQANLPGRMQGGGQVPSGMPGARSGVQVGRKT